MGANCCVAARHKPSPERISCEVSTYRNVRHSPSWSFRWDNRTHIEDIMDNPSQFSLHNSGNIGFENKSAADTETEGLSDAGSPSCSLQHLRWRKKSGGAGSSKSAPADHPPRSNLSIEGDVNSSTVSNASDTKPSLSLSASPSTSSHKAKYMSSSKSGAVQLDPSSSRKARRSPGYQLSRQFSDSGIPSLKSLNESTNCSPDDSRQSFVHSAYSNDLSAGGSQGGSSDGWSMRAFTELMAASSRRDRWSLDSENLSPLNMKRARSSPPSAGLQTCRVCTKLLKEKSPWSAQKIVSTNELSVAAILVCGHVYHADCLESVTSDTDRYDPPCPVCVHGVQRLTPKLPSKFDLRARNKISRRAVADIDVDGEAGLDRRKWGSSSSKGTPFLKRHFSLGSRPPRSTLESESSSKKKGFWAKYRRD